VIIVLDTNVLVSAIFFSGPPNQILKVWRAGSITLALSAEIVDEYRRVSDILAKERPPVDLEAILALIEQDSEFFDARPLPQPVCEDPDGDKFLSCAIASGAKIIVSGDKHLLRVSGYEGIEILKPKAFADRYLLTR
jgi:putative PIN family toxin of toxin-antitoxin system